MVIEADDEAEEIEELRELEAEDILVAVVVSMAMCGEGVAAALLLLSRYGSWAVGMGIVCSGSA